MRGQVVGDTSRHVPADKGQDNPLVEGCPLSPCRQRSQPNSRVFPNANGSTVPSARAGTVKGQAASRCRSTLGILTATG
jgi:hypothetical protein